MYCELIVTVLGKITSYKAYQKRVFPQKCKIQYNVTFSILIYGAKGLSRFSRILTLFEDLWCSKSYFAGFYVSFGIFDDFWRTMALEATAGFPGAI